MEENKHSAAFSNITNNNPTNSEAGAEKDLKLLKNKDSKKIFLNEILKIDKEKIKTSYNKLFTKHNFHKKEKNKIFQIRNTFVTSFNDSKEREFAFVEFLSNNSFDLNSLETQVEQYRQIFCASKVFPSANLIRIRKIISEKKEKIICQMLLKGEVKNKDFAAKLLNDIKDNNWKVSEKIQEDLLNIIQNY